MVGLDRTCTSCSSWTWVVAAFALCVRLEGCSDSRSVQELKESIVLYMATRRLEMHIVPLQHKQGTSHANVHSSLADAHLWQAAGTP